MDSKLEQQRTRRLSRTGSAVRVREVDDRVLLATLAAEVDVTRIRALNERLHAELATAGPHVVVLDLTATPVVGTEIAHELLNTAAMIQLMGSHVVTFGAVLDGMDAVGSLAEAVGIGRREAVAVQAR